MIPQNTKPIVYVIDDDSSVRASLEDLLSSVGLDVVLFASVPEFLGRRIDDRHGCIVLDIRMPGPSGLDLQQDMAALELHLPIIFITGHGDIPMSVRAMKAGAIEFLTKPFRDQDLLDAIKLALEKDLSARIERSATGDLQRRLTTLSDREREIFGLVVSGLLNKQIAGRLGTSEITIKVRRGQLMKKMGAKSFAELVRMAERLSLFKD
ncbi:hypothetical protein N185_16065 [Sinorhizobium sp. GW3]|nr:hypothetical protein N185_16065 [Sinorhizobium sp. GW3]